MKNHTLAIPILVLGLLHLPTVRAESTAELDQLLALNLEQLMAINVTISTKTRQSLSKAPSIVSVISAEDIKATGATNLTEILQNVPGIYVRENQFGYRPLVQFRGAAATQTLLMVNGAPVKDLYWSTGIFWKGLSPEMIDRVEIIRGPGSALFGSDASGGVINVITKTAGVIGQSEAGVRAGSFDSQSGWLQHGTKWGDFDIGLTANLSHTAGHNPLILADSQTAQDAKAGITTQASYAPGHAPYGWDGADLRFSMANGNWRLSADYVGHANLQTGLTGGGVLDPRTKGSDNRTNLGLFYNNDSAARNWGFNAELRYYQLDYTSGDGFQERPPGYKCTAVSNCSGAAIGTYLAGELNLQRAAERGVSLETSGLYTGAKNHAIRLGAGYSGQDLYSVEHWVNYGKDPRDPTGKTLLKANAPLTNLTDTPFAFAPEKARQVRYLFLQDVWSFADRWELTGGARYDHYSDFGGSLNPRLALVWQGTDRFTTKLLYGQAFRAPSYQELYSPTAASLPNPNLEPERSRTWDLSFNYIAATNLTLGLDIYRFAQRQIIASSAGQFQNVGDYVTQGVEAEAQWQATPTLRFSGNISRRRMEESPFLNFAVPAQQGYLRTDWAFLPAWNWNLQANWAGKHLVPVGDTRQPIESRTLVDTTIRYSPRKGWEVAASIRNLGDIDAREYTSSSIPDYLPLPRRNAYAEIRYKF